MKLSLKTLWYAAVRPDALFEELEPQKARIDTAGIVALWSVLALGLALTLGFIRLTGSDAWLPLVGFGALGALLFWLYAWGFGSLFLQRPGELDVRAWELNGWSWAGALFVSLSMLAPLALLPQLAAPALVVWALVWHLRNVRAGLRVFLSAGLEKSFLFYALFVYALPVGIALLMFFILSRLSGS